MLKRLEISQYVIIEHLTIDFADGLTVLTGETGAGKSILLDALGLMLGDDAETESIRQGASESIIEADFSPPDDHPVWAFLKNREERIQGPDLHIKRVIGMGGRDEIEVNHCALELPTLKELGPYLVEIHGQFANQNFLSSDNQLSLLDAFGAFPKGVLEAVEKDWDDIGRLTKELEEEKNFLAMAEREKRGIEQTLEKIETLGLEKGLIERQKAELAKLIDDRSLCETFQAVNAQLIAQSGAELTLLRVQRTLATQNDPLLDRMKECVKIALDNTRLAVAELQTLAPKYLDLDTSGIHKIEEFMAQVDAIAKERKIKPEELYDHWEYLQARHARIKEAPTRIHDLDEKLSQANSAYRDHARALSQERSRAALQLAAAINAEMAPLKLMSAQIRVDVLENPVKRTKRGINEVVFQARMNPGMPFSPISKTASGGEMARLILAIKMILQQVQTVSTLVFDEIDTGIGGAEAAAVGSRIAKLAMSTSQILIITHSPQVASRGDQHLHVSKRTDGTTTRTIVRKLTLQDRIDEVSRMLAGEAITDESSAAAKTLIDEARRAADERRAAKAAAEAEKAKAKAEAAARAKAEAEALATKEQAAAVPASPDAPQEAPATVPPVS
jgi:DNA repair protein RecN (Recombination protein N)